MTDEDLQFNIHQIAKLGVNRLTLTSEHRRLWRFVCSVFMAVMFFVALFFLTRQLYHVNENQILEAIHSIPFPTLATAILLTVLSYIVLSFYDFIGCRFAGHQVSYTSILPASLIAYSLSYNLGFSAISGTALRFRLFTTLGLPAFDVAKAAAFGLATFWIGFITIAGIAFTLAPNENTNLLAHMDPNLLRLIGFFLVCIPVGYLFICAYRDQPLRLFQIEIPIPSAKIALLQIMLSLLDWCFSSSIMFVLLKVFVNIDYISFLEIYTMAIILGALSTIPAGLGVVESVIIISFATSKNMAAITGALILYRVIYYLIPLSCGLCLLAYFEGNVLITRIKKFRKVADKTLATTMPVASALITFISGGVLLLSGATPSISDRISSLEKFLPLAFIEGAHLLGSVIGLLLLLVARGLLKRLSGAYVFTLILLAGGIVLSLMKGFDYEEALVLGASFLLLLPCRSFFYRRSSLLDSWMSPRWITAVTLVVFTAIWISVFAHDHIAYSDISWFAFIIDRTMPLELRASLCAMIVLLIFGFRYLLHPPRGAYHVLGTIDQTILNLVAKFPMTYANLALLGDKEFILNEKINGFVMYAKHGSSWIALGDPIASDEDLCDLIWAFREQCDYWAARPIFYQVDSKYLHHYIDAGFDLLKIGEEAIVELEDFSISGHQHKDLRHTINHVERLGMSFEIIPASLIEMHLPALNAISDEWLASHGKMEKGFSLGYFDTEYLKHFPFAIAKSERGIEAFTNIWTTDPKGELSCDLMRHRNDVTHGVMDFLFTNLMLWGKREGYKTFNLGMAPLSGVEERPHTPVWAKLESAIYRYGSRWYNFQGLRSYKAKFGPIWKPKYIACPNGLAMPAALLDAAMLIGGGFKKTFFLPKQK